MNKKQREEIEDEEKKRKRKGNRGEGIFVSTDKGLLLHREESDLTHRQIADSKDTMVNSLLELFNFNRAY